MVEYAKLHLSLDPGPLLRATKRYRMDARPLIGDTIHGLRSRYHVAKRDRSGKLVDIGATDLEAPSNFLATMANLKTCRIQRRDVRDKSGSGGVSGLFAGA